jgi:hypothetical protein
MRNESWNDVRLHVFRGIALAALQTREGALKPLCFLDGVCDSFFQIADAFLQLAFRLLL